MNVALIKNNLPKFLANLKAMQNKSVAIGIPHDKEKRTDEGASNALIGFVMEFGSGAKNIPPRPFLFPAIRESKDKIVSMLKVGAKNAIGGEDIHITFEKVGLIGQNAVKNKITNGDFEALKPQTVKQRIAQRKNGKAGTKPLINTGQLRDSISYVV